MNDILTEDQTGKKVAFFYIKKEKECFGNVVFLHYICVCR